ncbi:hypothetical protein A2T55_16305 [Brevibacterium linens]|uniref:BioF2-like acetyltransferase domain-containing protein n=1 Tax=Brevibacterium linens TaxID=1703 RepID=A0A144MIC2_BRELN|nr:GNAT family N-acetyltransferase [Brevibacterium linens]AMT95077.1 hypothetical protein A2T55_16305 [Brevibacterium linens]
MVRFIGPDAETWDRLAAHSQNIFQTRDFAEAWWAAYQPRGEMMVLVDRADDPQCILPLYRRGKTVPLIRQIGHGPADELGPLTAPANRGLVTELLRSELDSDLRRGVLVLHDVPEEGLWNEHLNGELIRSTPGPSVDLSMGSWDDFLSSRSRSFRKEVRHQRNRIERDFTMSIRASTAETIEDDLNHLFRLHRMRWGSDAPFAKGEQAELIRQFAYRCLYRGRLRLTIMELDGRPTAALLGLRFSGVHASWQSGRDPEFEQYSVGSVLMMDGIRAAADDGATEYRLLRGGESYKKRLADQPRNTCTLAVSRGPVGAMASRAARARRKVERLVAERLQARDSKSPDSRNGNS